MGSIRRTYAADLFELTKPRICCLALSMAALGFYMGSWVIDVFCLGMVLLGLALVGGASGILNQFLERDIDGCMWRTMNRPLPSGRFPANHAMVIGIAFFIIGELTLLSGTNPVTAVLAATTFFLYLGVYTPAKRVSHLSTLIGAVPGAMPPLMGWTAAYGNIGTGGLFLFLILFLWQIPHFLAIGRLYREDYGRAGIPVLSVIDNDGLETCKQILLYTLALLPLSLMPAVWGIAGVYYVVGAVVLGATFLALGALLAFYRTQTCARALFLYSLFYLPLLGLMMVWNRVSP